AQSTNSNSQPATQGTSQTPQNNSNSAAGATNNGDTNNNASQTKPDNSNNATTDQSGTNNNSANAPASSDSNKSAATMNQEKPKHAMMSRKRVEQIQAALDSHGQNIPVDGIWGPKTVEALKAFQKSNGLPATGHLDHKTLKALPTQS